VKRVLFVRPDEDRRARTEGSGLPCRDHTTATLEHEHLMLPGMIVLRCLTTGLDFDDAHHHARHTIALAQQPANAGASCRLLFLELYSR